MPDWILKDFKLGDLNCQLIEFELKPLLYMMVFSRINDVRTPEFIDEKANKLGLQYKENSFEVKFDLKENFESETFFEPLSVKRTERLSVTKMRKLGEMLQNLLLFHHEKTRSAAYIFVAENKKLKRFYDRLVKRYQEELALTVMSDL